MVIVGLGEVKMVVHEIQFRTLYTHFSFGVGDGGGVFFCWRGSVFFVVGVQKVCEGQEAARNAFLKNNNSGYK